MHEKAPPIAKVQLSASCQLCSPGPLLQSNRSDGLEYIAKLQWVVLYIYAGCIQAPIGSQSAAHQHAKTGQPVMMCHLETGEVDASQQAVIFTWFKLMCHDRPSSSPDASGQTVILPGSSWRVMMGCQLVLGEDDGPSWCVNSNCHLGLVTMPACHDAVW